MKLYEIDEALVNAYENAIDKETGEINEDYMQLIDELKMERQLKLENVALWIKDLSAEAEALKAEKMAFAERQRVAENKVESLKNYLLYALNGEKFSTVKATVSFRKNQSVECSDLSVVPQEFLRVKTELDKTSVKDAIKAGTEVQGCSLVEKLSVSVK